MDSSEVSCSVDVGTTPKRSLDGRKRVRDSFLSTIDEEKAEKIQKTEKLDESAKRSTANEIDSEVRDKYKELKAIVERKEEKLRKLKLVKMYKSQKDLEEMDNLITKWKNVTRDALTDYHSKLNEAETKPTLTQVIDHLSIDHELVGYNADEEEFIYQ